MIEISLHILDVVQNSIKAKATNVEIMIEENIDKNYLKVYIKDNGIGMDEEFLKNVTDPFVTTRKTRRVGLGLSLLKSAAELTGGSLEITSKLNEGTCVCANFVYDSIDRQPLGDMAFTLVTLITCNPDINFIYSHSINGNTFKFSTGVVKETLGDVFIGEQNVLNWIKEYIVEGLNEIRR